MFPIWKSHENWSFVELRYFGNPLDIPCSASMHWKKVSVEIFFICLHTIFVKSVWKISAPKCRTFGSNADINDFLILKL